MLNKIGKRHLVAVMVTLALIVGVLSVSRLSRDELARAEDDRPIFQSFQQATTQDQILVWNAPAAEPQRQTADNVGSLAWVDRSGQLTQVADVVAQSSHVQLCGPNAVSSDGSQVALYMGVDGGAVAGLYLMTNGGAPVLISDSFQRLGCVGGNGILSFSPDGTRLTYLAYERDYNSGFADGVLHIVNTTGPSELFDSDRVVAFDQSAGGVAFVNFFVNDRQEADEAALTWWDGNVDREVATFLADDDCRYLAAHVEIAPDGQLWLGMGYRCGGKTTLDLYHVNPTDRSQTLVTSQETGGAFSQTAQTNSIFFTPDSSTVMFTVPDGVTGETASLYSVDVASGQVSTLVDRLAVMPSLAGSANAGARLSPDGNWLAVAITSVNTVENRLRLWDLTDISAPALVAEPGGSGDVFTYMDFTADSKNLVTVAGGRGGLDNSIMLTDLTAETLQSNRVRRGTFSQWATLSPAGNEIAILEYQVQEDGVRGPDFLNLVAVRLDTSEVVTLVTGGQVEGGSVTNVQFAAPLLWVQQ